MFEPQCTGLSRDRYGNWTQERKEIHGIQLARSWYLYV